MQRIVEKMSQNVLNLEVIEVGGKNCMYAPQGIKDNAQN